MACDLSSMGLFSCFTKAGSREPQPSSISSRASHPQGANAPKNDHLKQGKRTQEGQEPDSAQQVAKESLPANALPSPNQQSHQHQEKPAQACCRQPGPPWKSARASGGTWKETQCTPKPRLIQVACPIYCCRSWRCSACSLRRQMAVALGWRGHRRQALYLRTD